MTADNNISDILRRLADVEAKLEHARSPSASSTAPDLASIRSILSPAMQASYDKPLTTTGTTPIFNNEHVHSSGDLTDLLSLRRNLSQPENPPFGVWWTYTIEETLSWPILDYPYDIHIGLDKLMDSHDAVSHCRDDGNDPFEMGYSLALKKDDESLEFMKRGLDDGTVVPELIESFLRNVHIKNPILDRAVLENFASDMIENGLSWDGETCQVLLACALGAISYPWDVSALYDFSSAGTSASRYQLANKYFQMAQRRIGLLLAQSSLISAQCLFLSGVYYMYIQEPVTAWRAFNSASIACRSYISRRIARANIASPLPNTHSMEQRLCWSCIKSEREIAVEFGMETSGLNVLAYSTSLPTPPSGYASTVNHPADSPENNTLPIQSTGPQVSRSGYENQSWYYYLTEIMLRKLEMRIDIFMQEKRKEAYRRAGDAPQDFVQSLVKALQEFDFQLTLYYQSLPPVMQFPLDDTNPCPDELRHYLRWRLLSTRHDITLPALYFLIHNDVRQWPSGLVAELVKLANICLELDMKFLRMAVTTHRHHFTWLGPRKGVRSALILLAAQRLREKKLLGLGALFEPEKKKWEQGANTLVSGLKYWSKESRDCSAYLKILGVLHPIFR